PDDPATPPPVHPACLAAAPARLPCRARPAHGPVAVAGADPHRVVGVGVPHAGLRRWQLRLQRAVGLADPAVISAVRAAVGPAGGAVAPQGLRLRAGPGGAVLRAAALVPVGAALLRVRLRDAAAAPRRSAGRLPAGTAGAQRAADGVCAAYRLPVR